MKKYFLSRLFYKSKHCKKTNTDNIIAMLLPSVLGIILCAVCLMGSTWAWFAVTQNTGTQTIQAINYTVSVKVNDLPHETNHPVNLEEGEYKVTLTADGDAKTGYCVLDFGNDIKAYTVQIAKGTEITLNLKINEPAILEITAVWGTYSGDETIDDEYTYGTATVAHENTPTEEKIETTEPSTDTTEGTTTTETKEILHTVTSNDTLFIIAQQYNTTVDKLQAYNNIENTDHIEVGDVIKIPIK